MASKVWFAATLIKDSGSTEGSEASDALVSGRSVKNAGPLIEA